MSLFLFLNFPLKFHDSLDLKLLFQYSPYLRLGLQLNFVL
ncbi:hypothetical protein F992_01922 [Acinetobacter modestus]|uniref:Uncharacterized protein n=1 Tax=Acinetobacter modestus TaxID=1776740 RepID=A0ABN0JMK8_9GAMM|nr:hypothetical protein F992_01922 [Acinetobacter modestus]